MSDTKKDYLGRPIKIGDTVIQTVTGTGTSRLSKDTVTKLSPKMVGLSSGNFKTPNKLIVIDAQIEANILEYPEHMF